MPPTLRRRVQRLNQSTLASLKTQTNHEDNAASDTKLWSLLQLVYASPDDIQDAERNEVTLAKVVENHDLNRSIHLFLATVVQNYVASWYLNKLNTDDPKFVVEVYQLLVEIARDVCARLARLATADTALIVSNQVASTIKSHFEKVNDETYLDWGHPLVATSQEQYLRVLTKEILSATFTSIPNPTATLDTTKIGSSLVQAVVADLVLAKVIDKLAAPDFLRQVIHDIAKQTSVDEACQTKAPPVSLWQRAHGVMEGANRVWTKFIRIRQEGMKLDGIEVSIDVLHHSGWSLLASMSDFQHRRPFIYYLVCIGREWTKKVPWLHRWLNHQVNSVLAQTIASADPKTIASSLDQVRQSLFSDASPAKVSTPIVTIDETVDAVINASMKLSKRFTTDDEFWFYEDETSSEYRAGIRNTIEALQTPQTNRLLIIQLLDIVVGELWDV